ncbi:MAG: hypothetical protein OHK0039_26700 [Bacteroidia bacterium]
MYRTGILLYCGLLATVGLMAQPRSLADSVATLYSSYLQVQRKTDSLQRVARDYEQLRLQVSGLETQNRLLRDSLSYMQAGLSDFRLRLGGLNEDLTGSLNQIQRLTQEDILSQESRLRNKKEKIIYTARFVRTAAASFDAIDAALAQSDYLNDVSQLNSPTNNELGFSLSEEVLELLDEKIIQNNPRFNNKDPEKVRQIVQTIVENPITTALTSSVPALSAIRAVVDLVSGLVVREREVDVEDFKAFKSSMNVYIDHYESLARASYDFNSNLDKLKVKANALRSILTNYTTERINTLKPGAVVPGVNFAVNDLIFAHYQWDKLGPYIDEVTSEYRTRSGRIDYPKALEDPRLSYPLYAATQAQFIQQELESMANEYMASYRLYHDRLRQILIHSKTLSSDPAKVDVKLAALDAKLELVVQTFARNVKIREVNQALMEIPAY